MKYPRSVWLSLLIVAALIAGIAWLAGRGREEPVRVYQASATPRPLTMETPATWRRVPPGRMDPRDIIYKAEAGEGRDKVQINVSLPGGDALMNINRWRGLVGLEDIEKDDLDRELKPLKIDQYEGNYVEMVAPERPAGDGADEEPEFGVPPRLAKSKVREAIYVAMVKAKGRTWFFRLKGPVAAAQREKATFKSFIENGVRALAQAVHEPTSEESADGK